MLGRSIALFSVLKCPFDSPDHGPVSGTITNWSAQGYQVSFDLKVPGRKPRSEGYELRWPNVQRWRSLEKDGPWGRFQWIGLREHLQENPIFHGKIHGFRFRFSLKPIHWEISWVTSWVKCLITCWVLQTWQGPASTGAPGSGMKAATTQGWGKNLPIPLWYPVIPRDTLWYPVKGVTNHEDQQLWYHNTVWIHDQILRDFPGDGSRMFFWIFGWLMLNSCEPGLAIRTVPACWPILSPIVPTIDDAIAQKHGL